MPNSPGTVKRSLQVKRNRSALALALAVVLVAMLVKLVVQPGATPDAEIRKVWEHHEVYEGNSLRVSGTLKRFLKGTPKDHYVLESDDGYRIGVDAAGLDALEGTQVTAVGQVVFDERRGLRLEPVTVSAR